MWSSGSIWPHGPHNGVSNIWPVARYILLIAMMMMMITMMTMMMTFISRKNYWWQISPRFWGLRGETNGEARSFCQVGGKGRLIPILQHLKDIQWILFNIIHFSFHYLLKVFSYHHYHYYHHYCNIFRSSVRQSNKRKFSRGSARLGQGWNRSAKSSPYMIKDFM